VIRGPIGFGNSSLIHTTKILSLSQDLPVVIEIVDGQGRIDAFLPELGKLMTGGLVTLEKVKVLRYGSQCRRIDMARSADCSYAYLDTTTATAQDDYGRIRPNRTGSKPGPSGPVRSCRLVNQATFGHSISALLNSILDLGAVAQIMHQSYVGKADEAMGFRLKPPSG
jgi:Uncharacterized ACR, COG1993